MTVSKLHFGECPVGVIGYVIPVVTKSDGTVRLECDSCHNQFASPGEARLTILNPADQEQIRPASEAEVAGTGWSHPLRTEVGAVRSTMPRPVIFINCEGVGSVPEFWQRYVDAATPENASIFGRNLDAFWDAIEDEGPGWPGQCDLVFSGSASLAELKIAGGASFLAALKQIAREATKLSISVT